MAIRIEQSGPNCQPTTFGNGTDDSGGNGTDNRTRSTESTESVTSPDSQKSISMDIDNLYLSEPAIAEMDLQLLGGFKPTRIIAHYSTMDNLKHTLYLGMTEKPGEDPLYEWERDLLCDPNLILDFELEVQ